MLWLLSSQCALVHPPPDVVVSVLVGVVAIAVLIDTVVPNLFDTWMNPKVVVIAVAILRVIARAAIGEPVAVFIHRQQLGVRVRVPFAVAARLFGGDHRGWTGRHGEGQQDKNRASQRCSCEPWDSSR